MGNLIQVTMSVNVCCSKVNYGFESQLPESVMDCYLPHSYIAYSTGQIIKPVCICVHVYSSVHILTVAFLH